MTDGRDRRSVLKAGATLCSVGLAGCVVGGGGDGGDSSDGTNDTDGADDPEPPEPEPVTSWPMQQYDAANTAAVPKAEAPGEAEELWRKDLGERIRSSPVVADGMVFLRDRAGTVHAVDETGDDQWTASVPEGELMTTPAIYEDLLLVPHDAGVIAFDRDEGTIEWEYGAEAGTTDLTVADDAVFFADTRTGVHAVEAGTGEVRWTYHLNPSRGFYTHPPAVDEGTVYVPTTANRHTDSREISTFGVRSEDKESILETEEYGFTAGLSVAEGGIFAPTSEGIRAYDRDGSENWHFETSVPVRAGLALAGDLVYGAAVSDDLSGTFYAIDSTEGTDRWSVGTRIWNVTGPIVVGTNVVFGDAEMNVFAYDRRSGMETWQFEVPFARFEQAAYASDQFYFVASDGVLLAFGKR